MSGFVKRRRALNIHGTRLSVHTGQSVTSSGNPSLDHIFGDGFPIGSIIGIEEDIHGSYARVLSKYFLAEGIVNKHPLLVGTIEENPTHLIEKLPKPVQANALSEGGTEQEPETMRIAFRYNQLAPVDSEQKSSTALGHYFDLTKTISSTTILAQDITYWNGDEVHENDTGFVGSFKNPHFASLLSCIHRKASEHQFNSNFDESAKNVLRICLNSIGSPSWYEKNFADDFLRFIVLLKAIVRNTLSVCLITVPFHLLRHLDDINLCKKVRNLFDFSFELEAFAGQMEEHANPVFKEYHGLLNITKIAPFNSLASFHPKTRDLAFKLKRSKFVIEKLHLPPDIADDDSRTVNPAPTLSCAGGGMKSKLDF
ncbi:elongator complex protein 4 isoform X1 [Anopheles moucheti]|uniref:elongator complex protein 4 isoform X1 n=1 Tax=Anopheles moucheti TaxID=186751 RepID=UPI0022F05E48|nr:elongator complex protein 4 isoform X1 [Anopheles moucheti]